MSLLGTNTLPFAVTKIGPVWDPSQEDVDQHNTLLETYGNERCAFLALIAPKLVVFRTAMDCLSVKVAEEERKFNRFIVFEVMPCDDPDLLYQRFCSNSAVAANRQFLSNDQLATAT
jgi:hypothetical protein